MINKQINLFAVIFIAAISIFCMGLKPEDNRLYINTEKVNLLDAPDGKKIALICKSTEMEVLQEEGRWVKIQITGWIQKPATPRAKQDSDLKKTGERIIQVITGKQR